MDENFNDRGEEKEWLEDQIERHGLAVLYGRRRVGKTALIEEVIQDKNAVYFLADQRPEPRNLQELQREMSEHVDEELFSRTEFTDWVELFREFVDRIDRELVVAVDEFPYLIEQNQAIPSIFQKIWDQVLEDEPVGLILCGSSVSMMETHVLDQKSPIYGRRTGQWLLEPLEFSDIADFFPGASFEERLQYYSVLDGIPAYLLKMDADRSVEWNLKNRVVENGAYLYQEAEFLLRQELRQPATYFTLLQAIAEGNTRFGEITNQADIPKSTASQYLSNLQELHVVEKEFPVTQKKESRNALYRLSDNYYDFWFDIVYPNRGLVEQGKQERLMERSEEKRLHKTAEAFEQVCRQVTRSVFDVEEVGRWWRNGNEIDVVGINEQEDQILLGECKWSENPVGRSLLSQLEEEADLVRWGSEDRQERYALFSKSGFTPELEEEASERRHLELFDLERLEQSL